VLGRNHAQLGAIDADLGLDIASSRHFTEVADQLLAAFGDRELGEQAGRVGVRRRAP
jgi:hypothetical protein